MVEKKIIDWPAVVRLMSNSPARIVGLTRKGMIQEGYDADLMIVDPQREWKEEEKGIKKKGLARRLSKKEKRARTALKKL